MNEGKERSVLAKKNIVWSFFNKGLAIVISLLLIPVTIDYLSPEQYGIWLTLSSIVTWISYFDVGLVHGFKNRFAEAVANDSIVLARQYVSTAFFIMSIIFISLMLVAEAANTQINWASFLKVSSAYKELLSLVGGVLIFFVCLSLILSVTTAMLMAAQRPAFASMLTTVGQGLALICIYVLTFLTPKSMLYISFALTGIPFMVLLVATFLLFRYKYKIYRPSFKFIRLNLIKNILGLGVKFFIIQISMLFIFQIVNIVLSRTQGPESVTIYNVSYKYFSVTQMVFTIILSPFWAAYTDAYVREDYKWMRSVLKKLNIAYCITALASLLLLIVSPFVFKIWLPETVTIPFTISISMFIYILLLTYSNMYMILINGIGKVLLQTIIYFMFAIISIPLMYTASDKGGIIGVLLFLSLVYGIQVVVARTQLNLILNNKAYGIWAK